jgi:hypothetical protein
MVLTTRIALAKAGTKSMKSTIPEGIVEFLQLGDKDALEWTMEVKDNQRIAVVRKSKLMMPEQSRYVKPSRVRKDD